MADIGKNIRRLRTEKNMKQDDLAEQVFVSRQTISNYENGKSYPDVDMIVKIAEVLETDVNTLIYDEMNQRMDRQKVGKELVKIFVLFVGVIVFGLLYKELWGMALADLRFEMALFICEMIRTGVFPLLSVLMGYYIMSLIHSLLGKDYIRWNWADVFHKIAGAVIIFYNIIMLPYCIYEMKSTVDYYRWKEAMGDGYWSSGYKFLPVWDGIVMQLLKLQWQNMSCFLLIFIVLGIILRVTKEKK